MTAMLNAFGGTTEKQFKATGFFRLERDGDKWWLVDPEGGAFITIGLNHTDETNLKYDHNFEIWKNKYGNRETWIREGLVKDMKDWGFNTIGWTSDYISGGWGKALDWFGDPINLGHSSGWSHADYYKADMPYVMQIRVAEIEDWNGSPSYPDVFSEEFEMYCDYLARSICAEHADSKNLIGYFFVDIPGWLPHASGRFFKGVDGDSKKLFDVATKWYSTITGAIKKYDPNHLILGDRYNGNKGIPTEVLEASKPYVDVLSIQYFPANNEEGYEQMREDFVKWQKIVDKPVINADIGNWCCTKMNPHRTSELSNQAERGMDYKNSISILLDEPYFIGWHWCAHIENKARGWGIKDPYDQPYEEFVNPVREFNKSVYDRVVK